ncbi:P-loop containing nucleoside triphosphate hydrolase protein [Paraphysoderma sedebokerense]|nr:P-loop containing nucleoside triphosphate hydrolase protein [Paraphysoderma sedebokerense]
MEAPSESVRFHILKNLVKDKLISPDVDLKHISAQTAALTARDLKNVITQAEILSLLRVLKSGYEKSITLSNLLDIGVPITYQDIDKAMQASRTAHSDAIGAPKIPNVSWDDVGGLASVKRDILDTIQLPLEHPELFATGMKKRSGVLLYGPPGTGKTLLAKAVATSCSLNFFSVKGPELLNMYIGESEANVRRIFQKAREAKPCVIFFDELDSVAPKRGEKGDSGGVMDRIVSQLLSELDGMADGGSGDVFVIGATNRPDLLDQALLRPGRFDKLIYLGVASDHDSQLKILQALTRKFRLAPELNLMDIAEQCPFTYTGADFYALCSDAMLKAMVRTVTEIDEKLATINAERSPVDKVTPQHYLEYMATPEETDVLVSKSDFELALAELVPSVSMSEMDHYKRVQEKFNKPNDKGAKGGKKEKGKMKA